jgi:hypothetical protein
VDLLDGLVWCDVHGAVHRRSTNPYDIPTERREGREVFLSYQDDGSIAETEPECTAESWRKVWKGGAV